MKRNRLTLWIFVALFIGVIFGWLCPSKAIKMQPVADAFLRMIKMIIAPLLFATLVVGISGHGNIKTLGKIGVKTIVYFEVVTTIALIIGLLFGNIFAPGHGFSVQANPEQLKMAENMTHTDIHMSVADMVVNIIPTSVIDAMATGNLLQIVCFSIFFAIAICAVGEKAKPVLNVLNSLAEIMFKFTEYVMLFAPIGVFAAISATIGYNGVKVLLNYAKIIFSTYFALAIFVLFVLVVACKICKVPFRGLIKALYEPALLAFSTASSEAALPKAMNIMEKFGVPKNVVGFVMPTGYTFNLDGSTLYLSLAVLFSTQILGIDLSLNQQIMIMLALMLTSKGIAGIPRVSLVVLAGTLASFNYPVIGVAILLGIDQILDMGRTTVNLIGNCVATVVISKWENNFDYCKMNNFLKISRKKNNFLNASSDKTFFSDNENKNDSLNSSTHF